VAVVNDQICPKCGEECYRESADVGVGVIYGPWGCPGCGWSESPHYDRSDGKTPPGAADYPDHFVDQWGCATPKQTLRDGVVRFGIDPSVIDEVFP
jgi:hypothetical protein